MYKFLFLFVVLFHNILFFCEIAVAQMPSSGQPQSAVCWESADCGLNHQAAAQFKYKIDTTLLPLELIKTTFSKYYSDNFPSLITSIQDNVILSDSSGNMRVVHGDTLLDSGFPHIDKKNITVRDIKYVENLTSLFACFHYVQDTDGTHHTAIGLLDVGKNLIGNHLHWEYIYDSNHKNVQPDNCVLDVVNTKVYFIISSLKEGPKDQAYAQDKNISLGKSYELDLGTRKTKLMATGHRMSLGIASRQNGEIWFTENAERGGDKLTQLQQDQNHGWPIRIAGTRYLKYARSEPLSSMNMPLKEVSNFTDAVYSWLPSIAPSAIIELNNFHPAWDGDLLVGSLKAQSLFRIHLKNSHVQSIEQIHMGQRVRGIKQIGKEIILTTDEGTLLKLSVDLQRLNTNSSLPPISDAQALTYCVNCHSFASPDVTAAFGPALAGVFGRGIAMQNFAYFSDSLKKKTGVWDEATLTAFLSDPFAFAPGTTMKIGVKLTVEEINNIVRILKTLK